MTRKLAFALSATTIAIVSSGLPTRVLAQPAVVSDTAEVVATVETVNQQERSVLLRGPNGGLLTVRVGPEVKNLAQVKPGDRVVVRYQEALAVQIAKPGEGGPQAQAGMTTTTAPPGQRPAGVREQEIRARVTITGINPATNTVSFVGPSRVERTVEVMDPEMRRFLRTLKVGDQVEVTYREALAISVEPAQR